MKRSKIVIGTSFALFIFSAALFLVSFLGWWYFADEKWGIRVLGSFFNGLIWLGIWDLMYKFQPAMRRKGENK